MASEVNSKISLEVVGRSVGHPFPAPLSTDQQAVHIYATAIKISLN
jgi:hypothetical protein